MCKCLSNLYHPDVHACTIEGRRAICLVYNILSQSITKYYSENQACNHDMHFMLFFLHVIFYVLTEIKLAVTSIVIPHNLSQILCFKF